MTLRISTILSLFLVFPGCGENDRSVQIDSHSQAVESFTPDTTKGWFAKHQYEEYVLRKKLAITLGLSDLENSKDTAEVRIWWEASMYSPSSVWRFRKFSDSLTAQRIDYYLNYPTPEIDSFIVNPSKTFKTEDIKTIISDDFNSIWSIPQYYETAHNKGCVDGETVSLEARKGNKYKTVSYSCYTLYKDSLEYQLFSSLVEKLLSLENKK